MLSGGYKQFALLLKSERLSILAILTISVVSSLLFFLIPLASQALVNILSTGVVPQQFLVILSLLAGSLLLSGVFDLVNYTLVEKICHRLFARVALSMSERLRLLGASPKQKYKVTDLSHRFFEAPSLQKALFKVLHDGPITLMDILLSLVFLSLYGAVFVGFSVLYLLLFFLILIVPFSWGMETSIKESGYKYSIAHWLGEMARCQEKVRTNALFSGWSGETDGLVNQFLDWRDSHFRLLRFQLLLMHMLKTFGFTGILAVCGWLVLQGELSIGQLVAAELVMWNLSKALFKFLSLADPTFDLFTSLVKLSQFDSLPAVDEGSLDKQSDSFEINVHRIKKSFGNELLFRQLSVDFKPGTLNLVLGSHDSGKRTLLNILSGRELPDSGTVRIGTRDLNYANSVFFGSLVFSVALHNQYCFPTLRDYVLSHGVTDFLKLEGVLEQLGLENWPLEREGSWDSELDEEGLNLSRREKLLLDFSLSVLSDKPIVLVQSDLELINEDAQLLVWQLVRERFESSEDKTFVFAGDELEAWMGCDQYLVLQDKALCSFEGEGAYEKVRNYWSGMTKNV